MVTLTVKGNKVYFRSNKPLEIKAIKNELQVFNEKLVYSSYYQEGHISGYVKFYSESEESFGIGLLNKVQAAMSEAGIQTVLIDENQYKTIDLEYYEVNARLHQHNKEAFSAICHHRRGIIKVPTRGGKTFIASELIRAFMGQHIGNILFVVDTDDLFDQAIENISEYLGIDPSCIGRIKGDVMDIQPITIASIATITSIYGKVRGKAPSKAARANKAKRKRDIDKYIKAVDLLIVDEIHEYSSTKRNRIIKKFKNVSYLMALSATPFPKDEIKKLHIIEVFGEIVYTIDDQVLEDRGILAKSRVLLVTIDHERKLVVKLTPKEEKMSAAIKYNLYRKKVIFTNAERNKVLIAIMRECEALGLKTLVLFESIVHGNEIAEATGYTFISGKDGGDVRKLEKNKFLKTEGGVLLASDIWKKGITLPEVAVMINADGGLDSNKIIQKRGRVLGVTSKKLKALIIDFVDFYEEYFSQHSLNRMLTYEAKVGRKKIDILSANDKNIMPNLHQYLKQWFEL